MLLQRNGMEQAFTGTLLRGLRAFIPIPHAARRCGCGCSIAQGMSGISAAVERPHEAAIKLGQVAARASVGIEMFAACRAAWHLPKIRGRWLVFRAVPCVPAAGMSVSGFAAARRGLGAWGCMGPSVAMSAGSSWGSGCSLRHATGSCVTAAERDASRVVGC